MLRPELYSIVNELEKEVNNEVSKLTDDIKLLRISKLSERPREGSHDTKNLGVQTAGKKKC